MSDNTNIEWCDSTFNPWIGCTKVGPGCDHCYAEADFDLRKHRAKWGPGNPRSRTSPANWKKPLQWARQHAEFFATHGRRRRVFCSSLADVFDNEVPREWRYDLLWLISNTPNLDWLILTKRIGNAHRMLTDECSRMGFPWSAERWPHVWLGATVVNQEEADRDIPKLLAVPAAVRWLSMEPLLGPVSLDYWPMFGEDARPLLHWIVVGGESGPKTRPMHPDWARSLRDQCASVGTPFLFKQWGEWLPSLQFTDDLLAKTAPFSNVWPNAVWDSGTWVHNIDDEDCNDAGDDWMCRVGKKFAGRTLDGKLHDGYPACEHFKEKAK